MATNLEDRREVDTLNTSSKDGILYVAAIEEYIEGRGWVPDFEYFHATSLSHANFCFRAANTQELISGKMKIVGIAPSIGVLASEETGLFI